MKIIDLFFYSIYNFLTKRLGRNKEDAKYSSVLLTSAFLSFFIIDAIILLGIIKENKFSQLFHRGEVFSFITIGIFVAVFLLIRYYKYINIQHIEHKISMMTIPDLKVMKIVIIFFLFLIPTFFLILSYIH